VRRARHLMLLVVAAAVAFGVVTLFALEGREVVVVETTSAGGKHRTRTWVADDDGAVWIEAANPERPFLRDLEVDPVAVIERAGARRTCAATIFATPEGHHHIRQLLAARYGWADAWIGLVADTHASAAIRFRCGDAA
jgi:hypothetical protein